jgi:thiol-disulfide isomerase/thioredoxin
MKVKSALIIALAAVGIAGALDAPGAEKDVTHRTHSAVVDLPIERASPSLAGASAWLNSAPLSPADLRGKVVLLDVWTYTCINWLRTAPYIRAWADKYKDRGLVVIGVHSPEFPFEHDIDNVRRAAADMHVAYPIAIDNEFAIWNALDNQYWPALYIVDAQGRIRHHQFGEGGYEQSERIIQQLLREAGNASVSRDLATVEARGPEAPAAWSDLRSPENYVGYDRTENFASSTGLLRDNPRVYSAPGRLAVDHWALTGDWTITKRAAISNKPNGRIAYRFHARDLHLVMGPATGVGAVRFRVLIDGKPPGSAHGTDVDDQGIGTIGAQRLYQLIRQSTPVADRTFEIEFLDPGAEAYAFTFG